MQKFSQSYNWLWEQYKTRTGKNTENKHIGPGIFIRGIAPSRLSPGIDVAVERLLC